jgi:hypothetical protein
MHADMAALAPMDKPTELLESANCFLPAYDRKPRQLDGYLDGFDFERQRET